MFFPTPTYGPIFSRSATGCRPMGEKNDGGTSSRTGVSEKQLFSLFYRHALFAHCLASGCILRRYQPASGSWKRHSVSESYCLCNLIMGCWMLNNYLVQRQPDSANRAVHWLEGIYVSNVESPSSDGYWPSSRWTHLRREVLRKPAWSQVCFFLDLRYVFSLISDVFPNLWEETA